MDQKGSLGVWEWLSWGKSGVIEDGPLFIPFEALPTHASRKILASKQCGRYNSKMEVSWPVNHIDYLLLYNLVAKDHVQEHRLK